MSDRSPFWLQITDEDILWASSLLKLPAVAFHGEDGTDPRQEVLKSMKSIDVQACPGSGKTTLLVAKLAILAKKWQYRTRGMCVVSHTNAARIQIETRLRNTSVGQRLLAFPHYIGTIHGFVNDLLAVPWLRSQGYPITMIDTEACLERRWNALPIPTRRGLEINGHDRSVLSINSSDFGVGTLRWGKGRVLGIDTPTYRGIKDVCRRSTAQGYFCYDEMFVWAHDMIEKVPSVVDVIRDRFPLLFIDEAQDNSEAQSAILHRVFQSGSGQVIRQRLGDSNQAIFDSIRTTEATTDRFPDNAIKRDLPNSHRFGQNIADLANPFGLIPYPSGLRGHGPETPLASGPREGRHTLFLFNDDSAIKVLEAYGGLLLETFSEQELGEGRFTAVGQIHRVENTDKFPHHIGHYWPEYDPELTRPDPRPRTYVQYVFAGTARAESNGETHALVEKTAEGILRLAGMMDGKKNFPHRRYYHRRVLELLDKCADVRGRYQDLMASVAVMREALSNETWCGHWRGVVREIAEAIAGTAQTSQEIDDFLSWRDELNLSASPFTTSRSRDNIYRYPADDPKVLIRVGSIHSVKGQNHTATLVVETFWKDKKGRYNLELLRPWLDGSTSGGQSVRVQQETRLKVHYVAMTRPTHLLCLAMKRSTFEDSKRELDHEVVQKLEGRGWQIRLV